MKSRFVYKLSISVGLFLLMFVSLFSTVWLLKDSIFNLHIKKAFAPVTQVINSDGKTWNLPTGDYHFQVASAATKEGPVFLEGDINPPDVHVGDVQHLRIVVQSPSGIKSVTANIETDNGEDTVELTRTGTVSFKDMSPEKYVVEADGTLKILNSTEMVLRHWQKIAGENLALAEPAKAAASGGDKEVWEGDWTVHDTHDAIYHTTFKAEDNDGLTNTLTIAWSDACSIPLQGSWTLGQGGFNSPCTISSTDGVENGDITIESNTLTINATFVFNPGYQINFTNIGQIAIGTGEIRKTRLWICDRDGDGWTTSGGMGTVYANDTAPTSICSGIGYGPLNKLYQKLAKYFTTETASAELNCGPTSDVWAIRRYYYAGGSDCYNQSSNAHPGSNGFCETNRGDGIWDYNCDNTQQKEYDSNGSCSTPFPLNCNKGCAAAINNGWVGTIPACGSSGNWVTSCSNVGSCIEENPNPPPDCSVYCPVNQYTCEGSTINGTQSRIQKCQ